MRVFKTRPFGRFVRREGIDAAPCATPSAVPSRAWLTIRGAGMK